MPLRPTGNNILLKMDAPAEKSEHGIFLTEELSHTGMATVIAAGAGKHNENGVFVPNDVKAGDRVMLSHFSLNKVKIDDEELVMSDPTQILAIINEQPA